MKELLEDPAFSIPLHTIDETILTKKKEAFPEIFRQIPLDIFGLLMLRGAEIYPNIASVLPVMPKDELQAQWTGTHGEELLLQSNAFVRSLKSVYERNGKSLHDATVLDYGCGWGRILRVLLKYVPCTQLNGVDPNRHILGVCRETRVLGNLKYCDAVPESAPFPGKKFDIIYVFSVFTHIPKELHPPILKVIHSMLKDDGIFAVTISPGAFWSRGRYKDANLVRQHAAEGYVFNQVYPDNTAYGRVTMTPEYIEKTWTGFTIVEKDLNLIDPLQHIIFLKKKQ